MNGTNNATIDAYNGHVQAYIDGTPHEVSGVVKDWLDATLADVPKSAGVLKLGSAFGRDGAYLQKLGYHAACSGATPAFVDLLRQKGFNARQLNAITDELPDKLGLVLANAVLLHFTRQETAAVIEKVFHALNEGGTFAFTLKQGEGEGWSDKKLGAPRYFCYWTEAAIRQALAQAGFRAIAISANQATANASWLQIIVKKPGQNGG
jgi:SAM-dependent methyltransferase